MILSRWATSLVSVLGVGGRASEGAQVDLLEL
jgi:hypothetical protein